MSQKVPHIYVCMINKHMELYFMIEASLIGRLINSTCNVIPENDNDAEVYISKAKMSQPYVIP